MCRLDLLPVKIWYPVLPLTSDLNCLKIQSAWHTWTTPAFAFHSCMLSFDSLALPSAKAPEAYASKLSRCLIHSDLENNMILIIS